MSGGYWNYTDSTLASEVFNYYLGSTEKLEITRKQEKNKVYKRFLCIYNTPKYGISVKNHTFWGR